MAYPAKSQFVRSQAFWMFIAAALFGYFGFGFSWAHRYTLDTPPQLVIMVVVLMWSLRGGCIAFALAGVLALAGTTAALVLYAVAGLATAMIFAAVVFWEWTSPYYSGIAWPILLIFAAWNAYSSVQGLREWNQLRNR